MMDRPKVQLYMLMSLDGKISIGDNNSLDFDKDLPKVKGVKEGLSQYYEIEKSTDIHSLNSGRVMAKVGANEPKKNVKKTIVRFIIIDNKPHLNESGVDYFIKKSKVFYLVTTNKNHPAFKRKGEENLKILYYPEEIDFQNLFKRFKEEFGIKRITIQSGGTLNSIFLREGLIDRISVVVAPVLVGGKDTSTLIDGESLHSIKELEKIKPLKLLRWKRLKDSYLHLYYEVLNYT